MSARATYSRAAVHAVTAYLAVAGVWLLLTRQIPPPGLVRFIRAALRPRFRGVLSDVRGETGYCFIAALPEKLLSDLESASRLELLEDGRPLGPAHASHDDIRHIGSGRYSHWGSRLYFSTADNSDPRRNGRIYEVREAARWKGE